MTTNPSLSRNPLDLNGTAFDPDQYLRRVLKEEALVDLIEHEAEMVQQIKALDSDMQTLVYENYNKFITATDTIRKMKQDFGQMEQEMEKLAKNMVAINEFSTKVTASLDPNRSKIKKLSETHAILKRLQFLYDLPARLQECLDTESYRPAVIAYCKVQTVMEEYRYLTAFKKIYEDCNDIMNNLKKALYQKFRRKSSTTRELAECIELFTMLKEPAEILCQEFLAHAEIRLQDDLAVLDEQLAKWNDPGVRLEAVDVLSFVDMGSNGFLSNVCLVVASYNDMFMCRFENTQADEESNEIARRKLFQFVSNLMERYFHLVRQRVMNETLDSSTCDVYVRALDRFSRRLQALDRLISETDYSRVGSKMVQEAASLRCRQYMEKLNDDFRKTLEEVREMLSVKFTATDSTQKILMIGVQKVHSNLMERVKIALADLKAFVQPEIMFASNKNFYDHFCKVDVRDTMVIGHFREMLSLSESFCKHGGDKLAGSALVFLVLSRHFLDLNQSTISYAMNVTRENFPVEDKNSVASQTISNMMQRAKDTAQKLLNYFVHQEGLSISQMIRKSVETRDWLSTNEPRTVRAVVKRVVEELTVIDQQVGQLFEEGHRKDAGSGSSKRTRPSVIKSQARSANWTNYSPVDTSLLSNIQKLFNERIEIFGDVDFAKVSILTGIVKIGLKTLLECVRLRTFGKFGLQQIQVDAYYLQQYLWRFVSDENLVTALLDEIVSSAVQRCLEPVLMEQSVVEAICDRG
ncbi:vacuolar protein sorting-associated protein 51 homolog [Paramacrobiotus metropolitanus]|uniref:vacuolar protein sorting-associated protein 51 homolog n=1 Tax=Paramacrobiotus metropolitanus TaxID=2943436 RepID=UPI0024457F69|nr:vacuolar protein sorting-associated protein 51 homolog [Paramacrobiotus metropolitanus]